MLAQNFTSGAWLRKYWAACPMFVLSVCLLLVLAAEHIDGWFANSFGFALFALIARLEGWKRSLCFVFLVTWIIGSLRWVDSNQQLAERKYAQLGLTYVKARLVEDAWAEQGKWAATARLHGSQHNSRKIRWHGHGLPPVAGTELSAQGVFKGFLEERNPGFPERARHWRNEGIVANFYSNQMRSERWVGPVSAWAGEFKKNFRKSIIHGIEEESIASKVILAIVLGEKARDSIGLISQFRNSGTLHIFSVSGMHVMMIGALIWFFLKCLGVQRRFAIPFIILGMFAYSWLAGNGPAAVRAACMGSLFILAFSFRRRPDLLNTLGIVWILSMCFDPRLIRMPGVQLSYGVVAAIGLGASWGRSCFSWIAQKDLYVPDRRMSTWQKCWLNFRKALADSFAVSTTASIGSIPLSAFHFGTIVPISVIATVALIPLVYFILSISLISALLFPLSEKASMHLNRLNALFAHACETTAGFFCEIPGAYISIKRNREESCIVYDLGLGASAISFQSGAGNSVLIDCGGEFSMKNQLIPSINRLGLNVDSLIFSHLDSSHVITPPFLLEALPIKQIAGNMNGIFGSKWHNLTDLKFKNLSHGDELDLGNGHFIEVFYYPEHHKNISLADDRCIMLRLHWHEWKILFTNDSGRLLEETILARNEDIQADVIVASLHKGDMSLTEGFVEKVNPQIIIVPRPSGVAMDGVRKSQILSWQKKGIRIMNQSDTGAITLKIQPDHSLKTQAFIHSVEHSIIK